MKKVFLISLVIVLAAGLIFSGCAQPAPTPPETTPPVTSPTSTATTLTPKYGGVLKVVSDPARGTYVGWPADMGHESMAQECLETLLRGDRSGEQVPWLAESYKIADDLKSITFTLRKEIKFHDGSDFNAEVAKWNLDNMINAKMEPYWASVDIIDDYTIRVNLTNWTNTIPRTFGDAQAPAHMISKAAFDKNGLDWVKQNAVGTGPFKFVSFTPDVAMKFVRNPDYWVKGKPYLDGFEYIYIADYMTAKMLMEAGNADMAVRVNSGKTAADYAALGLTVKTVIDSNRYLVPDSANADSLWANKKVREAVEYAIDREAIAKAFGYGYWQAPYQIPPRDSIAYDPNFPLARKYDPEKAKQLLAEAGYPEGFKTTISIANMNLGSAKDPIVAMQADLAKVGIQVDLDFADMARFATYMGPGKWPKSSVLCTIIPMQDPNFAGGLQFIFGFVGQSWLKTAELLQGYQAAFTSPSIDIKLIRVVTDMLTAEAFFIPIFEAGGAQVQQPYVVADFGERGWTAFYNAEDYWLNK